MQLGIIKEAMMVCMDCKVTNIGRLPNGPQLNNACAWYLLMECGIIGIILQIYLIEALPLLL